MSGIVTFYSYKGGVGRSMALANIAVLLARRGLRVLAVDWDLEAPGLERYFSVFEISAGGPGLLRMCMEARDGSTPDFRAFTSGVQCEAPHPITLLASGREQDEAYSKNLEAFDWEEFFQKRGGEFLEQLRERWRAEFDIVLIDSRTGLSDTGGICTIQLPDIVVAMFTANYQSMYGVRDVMRLAQKARQGLAYDRMPLSVLPLPARWGIQEFQETQIWLDRVTEAVGEFYEDWLPRNVPVRGVLEHTKVPQRDYFGFGEKLAVVEQGTSDPTGMGFVYERVAGFLASDLKDLAALVGEQMLRLAPPVPKPKAAVRSPEDGYRYDVFASYVREPVSDLAWELLDLVSNELEVLLGRRPSVFVDRSVIRLGDDWSEAVNEALVRSKVMIAFLTPRYVASNQAREEFRVFHRRTAETGCPVVVPVLLRPGHYFDEFREHLWTDFSGPRPGRELPQDWTLKIRSLASTLARMIQEAPPFDPKWLGPVRKTNV